MARSDSGFFIFKIMVAIQIISIFEIPFAGVAQLVEHQLPKLRVAGSSPVSRSEKGSQSDYLFLFIQSRFNSRC